MRNYLFDTQQGSDSPYGGLFDTSGPGDDPDDDEAEEEVAEQMADEIVNTSGWVDTGAGMALALPNPATLFKGVSNGLANLLGVAPPPAKAKRVANKVAAKIKIKAKAKTAAAVTRPAPRSPAMRLPRIQVPATNLNPAGPARRPITNVQELMQRVDWAQLAALSRTTVTASGSTSPTISVTRDGWVLDWLVNDSAAELLASNLTYGQEPNTIYNETPLGGWRSLAANHSPIEPVEVRQGASFNVDLFNPTGSSIIVVWTMSGIPNRFLRKALQDPDVAEYLAARGLAVAEEFARG